MAADYSGTPYASVATANIKGIQDAQTEIQLQKQIIKEYPNSEFAAEARFEIAELYLSIHNLNDPWQAIKEYARLVDQYPDSRRAAEAQLKIGEVYWRLNNPENCSTELENWEPRLAYAFLRVERVLRRLIAAASSRPLKVA